MLLPAEPSLQPSTFFSIRISVSGFTWKSLFHLDLSFVLGDKNRSICILLHDNRQLCQYHLLKMLSFFPLDGFGSFVKDQVIISVWVHFWVFNSIPLICLSVTGPVPCSFYHNWSVVIPPEVLLLLRIVFAILGFLLFQKNLQIGLSISVKSSFRILMGDCIESVDCIRTG